jgi:hypothetical protein
MEVLNHFLIKTIASMNYVDSSIGIATDFYGNRWIGHPEEANIENYYDLIVKSLVHSGDLVHHNSIYYKISSQALATLDKYAEEQARYAEGTTIQRRIVTLTIVLAVIAMAQIVVTVWEELHPDPAQQQFLQPQSTAPQPE